MIGVLPALSAYSVTEVTDISDPLTQWVSDPAIKTHGCYCATGGKRGLHQSDESDVFCKRWILQRRCLVKEGSICHHQYGHGITYNMNNDGTCAEPANTCEGAMCRVDRGFAVLISSEVDGNNGWVPNVPEPGVCGQIQNFGLFCDGNFIDPEIDPDAVHITTIPEQGVDEATEHLIKEVIDITTHGCYCSTGRTKGSVVVDSIDQVCREWIYARQCLMKRNGACRNQGQLTYSLSNAECNEVINDADSADHCRASACAIDKHFAAQIFTIYSDNPSWVPQDDSTCSGNGDNPSPTNPPNGVVKDSCCGTAPEVYAYSQIEETCAADSDRKRRDLLEIIAPESIAKQIPELLALEHDLEAEIHKKITNVDLFGVTEPALVMNGKFHDRVNDFDNEAEKTTVEETQETEKEEFGYVQNGEDLDEEEPEDFMDVNEDVRDFAEKEDEIHYIPHDFSYEKVYLDQCHNANVDIVFVIDGSGSVGSANFDKNIEYLKRLSSSLLEDNHQHETIQIAVVQYAWDYQIHLEVPFTSNLETLHYKLGRIEYSKGATFLGSALTFVESDVITQGRPGISKAVVTFTDGQVSYMDKQKLDDVLHSLETKATLFTVGLSKAISNQFIQRISSVPHARTGYRSTYDNIDAITDTLGNNICKVVS